MQRKRLIFVAFKSVNVIYIGFNPIHKIKVVKIKLTIKAVAYSATISGGT